MVEPAHPQLSVRAQCRLLRVNRNRLAPRPKTPPDDLAVTKLIDRIHMEEPTYGTRRLKVVLLRDHGLPVSRRRLSRLMRTAGIRAVHPGPRTSRPAPGHKVHPYLLRGLETTGPDEVWCTDITYIPMARGFCHLAAVMDWHTRAVLGRAVSSTIDTELCLAAWEEALRTAGRAPGIMNSDQGSTYTAQKWIEAVEAEGTRVSMDGRGRWLDNVFIERLWRSVKYEEVYLREHATPNELEAGLDRWFGRYNHYRPHAALDGLTPWAAYRPAGEEAEDEAA